jgi:hypothetical protein
MSEGDDQPVRRQLAPLLIVTVIAVITLHTAFTTLYGIVGIYQANANAVTTDGGVTETDVTSRVYNEGGNDQYTEYTPQVRYQYTVDGTRYNSSEVFDEHDHRPRFTDDSEARAVLPDGETVTVYHLPNSPDRSFLVRPSVQWTDTALSVFIFLPIGLVAGFGTLIGFRETADDLRIG